MAQFSESRKSLEYFKALKFCKSDVDFLNRSKKCVGGHLQLWFSVVIDTLATNSKRRLKRHLLIFRMIRQVSELTGNGCEPKSDSIWTSLICVRTAVDVYMLTIYMFIFMFLISILKAQRKKCI